MFPWLLALSGGLRFAKMKNDAAAKKAQMQAAAEQTRYSPWTGETGNAAFNQALQTKPMGDFLQGAAGDIAGHFAGQAAQEQAGLNRQAWMAANDPATGALQNFKLSGGASSTDSPWVDMFNSYSKRS